MLSDNSTKLQQILNKVNALPSAGSGGGGTNVSDTTATVSDVLSPKVFYGADGQKKTGTLVVQQYFTGSSSPASSLGNNGDIYLQG